MQNFNNKIWFDGKLIPYDEANIHVLSHCIHYGSGVFEGIKCYNTDQGPAVFRLNEHLERLHYSANSFKMNIPFSVDELQKGLIDLIKINEVTDCYLRPIAFYGHDTLGVHPKNCPVQVAIATLDWGAYISKEALAKGARITISPWRKFKFEAFPKSIKATGQYLNSLLAVQDAKSKGFDEALLLNHDDTVAEGSGQNIFIIKNNILHTNDFNSNILMGITRETLLTLINDMGLEHKIEPITKEDLFNADEIFYCGSASEVTPIQSIDDHIVGKGSAGDLTLKLQETYYNIVRGKDDKYHDWLTFINK